MLAQWLVCLPPQLLFWVEHLIYSPIQCWCCASTVVSSFVVHMPPQSVFCIEHSARVGLFYPIRTRLTSPIKMSTNFLGIEGEVR